jgi:hypothetical protein
MRSINDKKWVWYVIIIWKLFHKKAWIVKTKMKKHSPGKNILYCRLHCDQCWVGGRKMVIVGNKAYEHHLWNIYLNWYESKFIIGFIAMMAHNAHMSAPPFKTKDRVMMVFTPYPN